MLLKTRLVLLLLLTLCASPTSIWAQTGAKSPKDKATSVPTGPLLKRSTTVHDTRRFAYGGTLTIIGPPAGSISIEGWEGREVEITANIEWQAPSEQDLAQLVPLNNFIVDEDANHLRILTTGTHDKVFMRRVAKNFSKPLLGLPWKIDFRIKVPVATDLEINAGNGPITLSGVEGAVRINALESDTTMTLTGGNVYVTVLRGSVNLDVPSRGWRGSGAEVRLASGILTLALAAGSSADIDADLLRLGQIENSYADLLPREHAGSTPRSLRARAGSGGATLRFTVGDGILRIKERQAEH